MLMGYPPPGALPPPTSLSPSHVSPPPSASWLSVESGPDIGISSQLVLAIVDGVASLECRTDGSGLEIVSNWISELDNYPISLEHFHLAGVLDMENVETVDVARNEDEQRFDTAPVDTPVVSGTLMTAEESTVVGEDWKTVLGLRLEKDLMPSGLEGSAGNLPSSSGPLGDNSSSLSRFEDLEGEDVLKSEFCADFYDNVRLCYHIDEEHPVKAKNGVLFCGWDEWDWYTSSFSVPHYMSEAIVVLTYLDTYKESSLAK
ncbi:hypothetical protein Bca52824_027642 [Brassica carinata]|uniref:Uncharacterized protein n=1 Tax=Brassica carinata TaxID=52824 RepID=A0A8X7VAY4_BRACI|nr:hypothetical protein Bca52824_027642 [Brassica carinata]